MTLSDFPAFRQLGQPPGKLLFERAIWGKVDNARSDFRWIARSQNFRGHLEGVERGLKISNEEEPRKLPLWRPWKGRYYAVSCRPSRARDAANRSGFLEKQIIEWEPNGFPAALGALILLPLAASPPEDIANIATARASDSRWVDLTFSVILQQPPRYSTDRLPDAINEGLRQLQAFSDATLETLFADLGSGKSVALLPAREPLGPEALAALLLPLSAEQASNVALAGWVPSRLKGIEALENWNLVACDAAPQPQATPAPQARETAAYARRCVQVLRGFHPAIQQILDFSEGPSRWLDPSQMKSLQSMLYEERRDATEAEKEQLRLAYERVRQESQQPLPGVDESIQSARQRHLLSKAKVIHALAALLNPPRPLEDDHEARDVLERWRENAGGEVRSRINTLLRKD